MKYFAYYLNLAVIAFCADASAQTWIIEPKEGFGFNYPFAEGLAIVQDEATQFYGLIDSTGHLVMPYHFSDPPRFSEGQAVVNRLAENGEDIESYLLEKSGRGIRLSDYVEFSLGYNYFGRVIETEFDADNFEEPTFEIFKIAKPELLTAANTPKELALIPVFNERPIYSMNAFSHGYLLIDEVDDYFVRPDGSIAYTMKKAERSETFDENGYAQFMDADSVYLINTSFQKVYAHPRDVQRDREFYFQTLGDGYALLTSTFNEEWETSIIHFEKPFQRFDLGPQADVFPLSKEGRYWDTKPMKQESDTYLCILKSADGKELQRIPNYRIEVIDGSTVVMSNGTEVILVNGDGQIIHRVEAESAWYGGKGYLWVMQGTKTGLLHYTP